ncbi:uncharacterized protein LOC130380391 isoform X6 [Gadus chalcogrammus]|uniref:uncharacterized protein LOC130380391 isoform X6 n=1 Tax=Gadus chalcogrammus TaxID=1042646 RepID=UPI0024C2857D|nr:uncharacterized protein LOC130380391 isoform X6 [Gadus chalcogrammus]
MGVNGARWLNVSLSPCRGNITDFIVRFSGPLFFWLSAVLVVLAAQGEPKYLEVGTTLTLEPDVSTVQNPIDSIRWKYGTALVVDWDPSGHTYYGSFRGRTTLDPQTLRLVINPLTLADSGQFSLETNLGTVGTHEVKVIRPPPTPSIKTQPLCNVTCTLKCSADTQDLGPVSYEWKKDEGEWTKGDELKNISSSDTPEKFSCRLRTPVRTSNTSLPMENPLYKPPGAATEGGAVTGPPSSPGVTEDGTRGAATEGGAVAGPPSSPGVTEDGTRGTATEGGAVAGPPSSPGVTEDGRRGAATEGGAVAGPPSSPGVTEDGRRGAATEGGAVAGPPSSPGVTEDGTRGELI